jgi:lipopolysaccharide export LptBFGC system permease protein LptF
MSRTLFWYILRDLLRTFLLTSGVLAGILSFGGVLVQIMKVGINGWQVTQMLTYLLPAMQTYSLSFAALFATTMVYGRLSADNELTACRATGISYISLAMPAVVMGLVLAIASLGLLSYAVPHYLLKSERVIFESLGDLIQHSIQRSHQFKMPGGLVVFADSAEVLPAPADAPDDEQLVLHEPMFCTYRVDDKTRLQAPSVFYVAKRAQARLRQGAGQVTFWALLDDGMKIPRESGGTEAGGFAVGEFGPIVMPSPMREQTKFMNITQLNELFRDPTRSRDIRFLFEQITAAQQEQEFLQGVVDELRDPRKLQYRFEGMDGQALVLAMDDSPQRARPLNSKLKLSSVGEKPSVHLTRLDPAQDAVSATLRLSSQWEDRFELVLEDVQSADTGVAGQQQIMLPMAAGERGEAALTAVFEQLNAQRVASFEASEGETYVLSMDSGAWLGGGSREFTIHGSDGRKVHLAHVNALQARELELIAQVDRERKAMRLEFDLSDVVIGRSRQHSRAEATVVAMSPELQEIGAQGVRAYLGGDSGSGRAPRSDDVRRLSGRLTELVTDIQTEIHGRVSFAISCLVLMLVGCALGMMFKTANYLSAFGVSVVPAMLCIAVVATGQHVVENDPRSINVGLGMIWSGNILVFCLGVGLLGWLQRK